MRFVAFSQHLLTGLPPRAIVSHFSKYCTKNTLRFANATSWKPQFSQRPGTCMLACHSLTIATAKRDFDIDYAVEKFEREKAGAELREQERKAKKLEAAQKLMESVNVSA